MGNQEGNLQRKYLQATANTEGPSRIPIGVIVADRCARYLGVADLAESDGNDFSRNGSEFVSFQSFRRV
jgi:hypothetical protein